MSELLHGCVADVGDPAWCFVHRAFLVADRPYCWATIRPNGDPLDATTREGYDSAGEPVVPDPRPVVDDRGMVIVWIVAALAFVAAMVVTILAVAGRPPNG